MQHTPPLFKTLEDRRYKSAQGGGKQKIEAQHKKGKLTARERIQILVDPKSFVELDAFVVHQCNDFGLKKKKILGDGVVTGWATINGRTVYLYAQDFTVFGGSLSEAFAKKICKVMTLAIQNGAPIIGLNDSGGARIHEGVASLGGYADLFKLNVDASGVIPQLSLIMGPCAGGAVYSPALTDFIFMVDHTSHMFITGPNVVKTVTGEDISFEDLGGSKIHSEKSGVADLRSPSEQELLTAARTWLSYVPSNNLDAPPLYESPEASTDHTVKRTLQHNQQQLDTIIPDKSHQPYQMIDVIRYTTDPNTFFEMQTDYAPNLLTGFARIGGNSVGIIANNPQHLAGVLDINASTKGARFIRFCDAFNLPVITFVDVPGFLPGSDQEHDGIIRQGAKLLYAYCEATVPLLTVITRKAYGGAYDVMSSKHIGADLNLAWPSAEIAVMGAAGACQIIFNKQISEAKDPKAEEQKYVEAYAEKFASPYEAATRGYIDAVIFPHETRSYLLKGLQSCLSKRIVKPKRKHGNMPL